MKKILLVVPVPILIILAFVIFTRRGYVTRVPVYEYTVLKEPLIAKAGLYEVARTEVVDPHLEALLEKQKEVQIFLAYKQFVEPHLANTQEVVFGVAEPARPLKQILGQFGGTFSEKLKISFSPQEASFIQVDGKMHSLGEVNLHHVQWWGVVSDIFNYQLRLITQKLESKALAEAASKAQQDVQTFINGQIMPVSKVYSEEENTVAMYELGKTGLDEKSAGKVLEERRRNQAVSEYLRKNVIPRPIQVHLTPPDYKMDLTFEWTQTLGNTKAPLRLIVVSNYWDMSAQNALYHFAELHKKWPDVLLGFRPVFGDNDYDQRMIAEMSFCVSKHKPESVWSFLARVPGLQRQRVEEGIYKILEEMNLPVDPLKSCFLSHDFKKAVDYHLSYAKFHGIYGGPVFFVGREVFIGPLTVDDIETILQRQD